VASVVLRTSRFSEGTTIGNAKVLADDNAGERYLFRRVAIEDVVDAHLLAIDRASAISFKKYIISATTPFLPGDCAACAWMRQRS
jgi:hypothetical protein